MTKRLLFILFNLITSYSYGQANKYIFERTEIGQEKTRKKSSVVAESYVIIQPSNLKICQGDKLRLIASTNTNQTNLSYVWKKDGVVVGTNSNEYLVPTALPIHSGTYTCTVKLSSGIALPISNVSTVSCDPTLAVTEINSNSVCQGTPLTCNVKTNVTENVFYQWMSGGKEIVGAIYASYTKPISELEDNNKISCKIIGKCGFTEKFILGTIVNEKPYAGTVSFNGVYSLNVNAGSTFTVSAYGYSPNQNTIMIKNLDYLTNGSSSYAPQTYALCRGQASIVTSLNTPGYYQLYNIVSSPNCPDAISPYIELKIISYRSLKISDSTDQAKENIFKVFPNPSDGQFRIDLSNKQVGLCKLNVRDVNGKLIYTSEFLKQDDAIEQLFFVPNAVSGVYILDLELAGESYQTKLIIVK